jgi:hypothetical protein
MALLGLALVVHQWWLMMIMDDERARSRKKVGGGRRGEVMEDADLVAGVEAILTTDWTELVGGRGCRNLVCTLQYCAA